jgi:nucleoside-diphosphate-sugar epimerase
MGPSVIDGLLRGEPVNGTHGNQVRDFIHADDGADACIALLDSRLSGPFNVGTGRGCSLREVAAVIVAELGRGELPASAKPQRAIELMSWPTCLRYESARVEATARAEFALPSRPKCMS